MLGSFLMFMLYVVVVVLYVSDPLYSTVIVLSPLVSVMCCVMLPVFPVCVFIVSPFGSVIIIGALVMVVPVTLSFTVMFILVLFSRSSIVVIVMFASRFSIVISVSVVLLG